MGGGGILEMNNNEAVILAQAMDASPATTEQWSACAVFTFNNGLLCCGPDYRIL